ncbi:hypothetical protein B5P44_15160 [Mycobacterium sp. CBMA 213]|nr:hypothetical protein [Mycolicibacterium sp. CBMA 213]
MVVSALGAATQPQSSADAPTFPDMSRYVAVNSADYEVDASTPGIHATKVVFLTPDGITCDFMTPPAAICTGNNFPSVPPAAIGVNSIGTDYGLTPVGSGIPQTNNLKTLPPFHTITANGVTCGVDDAHTTACKDSQGHGFVLSHKGSGWLPHV